MRYFITGCAGFIGSQLTERLLQEGHQVVGYDNFSTGREEFLTGARQSSYFRCMEGDVRDKMQLTYAMKNCDTVIHLAANADVRFGLEHPEKDLEYNTIATFNVLEAMRTQQIKCIVFASTGSIYGEAKIIPTPEDAPFPIQTSLYGASKLAAEGLIQAYCEGFNIQAFIFRFVSILGERYTHGHVFDFYKKLLQDPTELHVLGNGKQRKSYLYVQDCIEGILFVMKNVHQKINIFNLGTDEYCEVNDSIGWICDYLALSPKITYSGGVQGWVGDNPFIYLDCSRIRKLGWKPKLTIKKSVLHTIEYLHQNPWVLQPPVPFIEENELVAPKAAPLIH